MTLHCSCGRVDLASIARQLQTHMIVVGGQEATVDVLAESTV